MDTSIPSNVNVGQKAAKREQKRHGTIRKILLCCGILSALWYVAVSIIVPLYDKSYSAFSQTVSELSALGAPTRRLWVILCLPFTLLEIAFGWGVGFAAGQNRCLRLAAGLLLAYGLIGAFWPPMHLRAVLAAGGKTMTDTMHIVFTAVTGLLMMLAMGFGAAALGKRFRLYTITTLGVLLVFGTLTALDAPRLEANRPTPWMGVWERVNIYATMLWMLVFAIGVLRRDEKAAAFTTKTSV